MCLLDSVVGLAVVFFALVLLMCMIKIMTAIGEARQKKAAAAAMPADLPEQPQEAPLQKVQPLAPGSAGDVKLYDTDPRTAAMLMAIVADELKAPINELRFLSIREIKEEA
jgi:Na+-transporting methylmalonyl-CoA/oxaloacetate decarboxylase gamma subunit